MTIEFHGKIRVKAALAAMLRRAHGEVSAITNFDAVRAHYPEFELLSTFSPRQDQGLPARLLYSASEGPVLFGTDHLYNRVSRFIPYVGTDVTICQKEVFVIYFDSDVRATCVTTPLVVQSFRMLFEVLWDLAS